MSLLVPFTLFGWLPLTIYLFMVLKPYQAVVYSIIGGTLFLPMTGYDMPGLPPYTKNAAIAISLLFGYWFSGQRQTADFHWSRYDIPMLIWMFCPLATSLANNLGWYDGLAGCWGNITTWGIPYLAGRIYIDSIDKLNFLCIALVIGGLLYLPLCLYEIRLSPQLSNMVYGFFPHSFGQHIRYGGFRPIVFMQHGLMVSMWMAAATTAAFWLWRNGKLKQIGGIPLSFLTLALIGTTILCKSANGWIVLTLGCGGYFVLCFFRSYKTFRLLLLLVPCYMILRITGIVGGTEIINQTNHLFDAERVSSLEIRLLQEDLFVEKTLQRPLLGWGGYGRGWPVNEETGRKAIQMIDSLWLITFNIRGLVGLFSMSAMMLIGPWLVLRSPKQQNPDTIFLQMAPILLSHIVVLFMIDSLVNGMINPVYILVAGSLVGWFTAQKRKST